MVGAQHIALVRAPTNAQGSGGKTSIRDSQGVIIRRTFGVRLTEDIELARDAVNEGLIDGFEETVRVWVRLDGFSRRRIPCLFGGIEKLTRQPEVEERWRGRRAQTSCPAMRQRRRGSFRVCRRHGSSGRRGDGRERCRTRAGAGLRIGRRAATGWGRGRG
jgi:hypothetical protein